jgi:acetolactate synthase regulatory subunit
MKETFCWQIECKHTPETIDRILLPIRKRGMMVNSLNYKVQDAGSAICLIEVDVDPAESERIHKNMLRIQDIHSIVKL